MKDLSSISDCEIADSVDFGDEPLEEGDEFCSSASFTLPDIDFDLLYIESVYALRPIICFFIVEKMIRFSARGDIITRGLSIKGWAFAPGAPPAA